MGKAKVLSKRTVARLGDFIRYRYKELDIILVVEKIRDKTYFSGKIVFSNDTTRSWQIGSSLGDKSSGMYIDLTRAGWDTVEILEDYKNE